MKSIRGKHNHHPSKGFPLRMELGFFPSFQHR